MSRYIAAREGYDTLLEIEELGAKIRDTDDEFKGAPFRDEKTKFLFCYDYENRFHFRVWGTTFKPALFNECKRLGVQVFDRVVATSLLTEGGKTGARVVGATGYNVRTGEFYVFKAKATIDCMAAHMEQWGFSTELTGINQYYVNTTGDGPAILWRAGAVLTNMERNRPGSAPGYSYPAYGTGSHGNTWYPATIVDANGKEIPWIDSQGRILKTIEERTIPDPNQKFIGERCSYPLYSRHELIKDLSERIIKGEFTLPLYADLTSMPWYERKVIWGLMVGQEGKTGIPVLQTYEQSGFDSSRDMLQSYLMLGGAEAGNRYSPFRSNGAGNRGETVVDWDLKTTLDGLYAAGDALFAGNYYGHACITGRYAGRKAADYALKAEEPVIDRKQVNREKARVYAPTKAKGGVDWKELRNVSARAMQTYCGGIKNEGLLQIGLKWLNDIENSVYPEVNASNPHLLLRILESYNMITCDQAIIHASLARKASNAILGFNRQDYPAMDPPEWHKWITVKLANGKARTDELAIDFWGKLQENYEAHNKEYKGYLKK